MSILEEIAAKRRKNVSQFYENLEFLNGIYNKHKNFFNKLDDRRLTISDILKKQTSMGVISELKVASPSNGTLQKNKISDYETVVTRLYREIPENIIERDDFLRIFSLNILRISMNNIVEKIKRMVKYGAVALSVLTESEYFSGSFGNLLAANLVTNPSIPLLLKDFIVDKSQLELGRYCGASNALLIVKLQDDYKKIEDLVHEYHSYGLEPLIELHDFEDFNKIKNLKSIKESFVIGVNNRDLRDLKIDFSASKQLIPLIKDHFGVHQPVITESGIYTRNDFLSLKATGAQAALIGSSITEYGIKKKLEELLGQTSPFVKICGVKESDFVSKMAFPNLNAIGCVVGFPKSHRNLSISQARQIFQNLPNNVLSVAVTKDKSLSEVELLDKKLKPSLIQNHVQDPIGYCLELPLNLQSKTILPINIKKDNQLFNELKTQNISKNVYEKYCQIPTNLFALLIDSSEGTAQQQPISYLKQARDFFSDQLHHEVLIAGGIGPENVRDIISNVKPFGIDASSKLEANRTKDMKKIINFMEKITTYNGDMGDKTAVL